ncbi:g10649 [Coccomyxa elongata]
MPGHRFKVSAVLPIAASDYFIERDSAAFRSLVSKSMKVGALEIVDCWMEGNSEVYKFVTKLDVNKYVPKSLQKHFSEGLHYTDIITYDPKLIACAPYRLPVKSIAPIFPEKARIECTLLISDEEPGVSCRQTLEGEVEFKLMGLGRLAQRIVVDNLEKVYQSMPMVVQRWVEFRNEVLQQEGGRDILFSGRPDNHGIDWISERITTILQAPYSEQTGSGRVSDPTSEPSVMARGVPSEAADARPEQAMPGQVAEPYEAPPEAASHSAEAEGRLQDAAGEIFYDASDDWPWADEEAMWDRCTATEAAVKTDHAAAIVWIKGASQHPAEVPMVDVTAVDVSRPPVAGTSTDPHEGPTVHGKQKQHRTTIGRRFTKELHRNEAAWDKFWDQHQVPVVHAVPDMAARLSHLLRVAIGAPKHLALKLRAH